MALGDTSGGLSGCDTQESLCLIVYAMYEQFARAEGFNTSLLLSDSLHCNAFD